MPTEMTPRAASILKDVLEAHRASDPKGALDAMQEADELGGIESEEDYALLMQAIADALRADMSDVADEALKRKAIALEIASIEAKG